MVQLQDGIKHLDGRAAFIDKHGPLRLSLFWGLISIAIVVGILLRFNGLKEQSYFADELVTSAFVSGAPMDRNSRAADSPNDVLKFEHLYPDTSALTVVENLSKYCADQTPCYYVLCRAWAQITGGDCSAETLRSLSALIGLLLIASMYFLCLELFGTPLAGGIGAAVTAVSPFHIIWSQHARPYALWSLLVVWSLIALLRATRLGKFHDWLLYALCATTAAYTHLLSIFVIGAHTLSVLLIRISGSKNNKIRPFSLSLFAVICMVALWRQFLKTGHYCSLLSWMERKESFKSFFSTFFQNFADSFLTFNWMPFVSENLQLTMILSLLLYSLYYLNNSCARKPAVVYVTTLALVPFLCLLAKDIFSAIHEGRILSFDRIEGSFACMIIRYLTPCIIGFQLALIYMASNTLRQRKLSPATLSVVAVFLVLSTISCLSLADRRKPELGAMARIINESGPSPALVKSQAELSIPLSRLLREDVKLVNLQQNDLLKTVELYPGCFVFASQSQIDAVVRSGLYACRPCRPGGELCQINRKVRNTVSRAQ